MPALIPSNDLFFTVLLETVDGATFTPSPLTAGSVTALIATSNDPNAQAADPSLETSAVHVGVANPAEGQYPLGTWGITFAATALTPTLLDSLFNNTGNTPYLIVDANGVRVYQKLKYARSRSANG